MRILIPAAGEGIRLRPHTLARPKPLLRLAGKTVIDYLLDPLLALNPSELTLVVGYRGAQLVEHLRDEYDLPLRSVEQDKLLGLGYAVYLGLEQMELDEDLLILLSDTIVVTDFSRFIGAGANTIALREVQDPRRFGVAETEGTRITRLVEKPAEPATNLAVVGLYYFREPLKLKHALEFLMKSGQKTSGEIQLTDALAGMIGDGEEFTAFKIDRWLDCGTRETMLSTNAELLDTRRSTTNKISNSTIDSRTWIDPSVEVTDSTIGPNVTVYEKCRVYASSLENCIIGPNTEITSSSIVDSIIGQGNTVSAASGRMDIGDYEPTETTNMSQGLANSVQGSD
ncbi:MAG: sugar phosphate nucleotidyltransferase [Candidatus Zixiibacteriota bacterium]